MKNDINHMAYSDMERKIKNRPKLYAKSIKNKIANQIELK